MNINQAKQLLNGGTGWRGDCPDCGGHSTLSVSNVGGTIKWYCFRASCNTKGVETIRRTLDEIMKGPTDVSARDFSVPAHFTAVTSNEEARLYCAGGYFISSEMRYDPRLHRAVFLVYRDGGVVDAIGKALASRRGSVPKWYRYGQSRLSYMSIGTPIYGTCVVVEDIPSACVVRAAGYDSMALMSTHMSDLDIHDLMGYNRVIVALDPDAYSKGIVMADRLGAYTDAKAIPIPDDLKYYTLKEVQEILCMDSQ